MGLENTSPMYLRVTLLLSARSAAVRSSTAVRRRLILEQTQYSGFYLYPACITFIKLSILYRYWRIFPEGTLWGPAPKLWLPFRTQVKVIVFFVILWCIGVMIASAVFCVPLPKFWRPQPRGYCYDFRLFYYGVQIPIILTDILLSVCPAYELARTVCRGYKNSRLWA